MYVQSLRFRKKTTQKTKQKKYTHQCMHTNQTASSYRSPRRVRRFQVQVQDRLTSERCGTSKEPMDLVYFKAHNSQATVIPKASHKQNHQLLHRSHPTQTQPRRRCWRFTIEQSKTKPLPKASKSEPSKRNLPNQPFKLL